jgi:hypothetical protein
MGQVRVAPLVAATPRQRKLSHRARPLVATYRVKALGAAYRSRIPGGETMPGRSPSPRPMTGGGGDGV